MVEDVFAGYKTMLRGGRVVHVEYHQLGKGRMTNLGEVNGFFAKLSQGAACQLMSRDLYRLNRALPPDRALSLFFSEWDSASTSAPPRASSRAGLRATPPPHHLPHPASFSHLRPLRSRCSCSRTRSPSSRSPASSARLWGCPLSALAPMAYLPLVFAATMLLPEALLVLADQGPRKAGTT